MKLCCLLLVVVVAVCTAIPLNDVVKQRSFHRTRRPLPFTVRLTTPDPELKETDKLPVEGLDLGGVILPTAIELNVDETNDPDSAESEQELQQGVNLLGELPTSPESLIDPFESLVGGSEDLVEGSGTEDNTLPFGRTGEELKRKIEGSDSAKELETSTTSTSTTTTTTLLTTTTTSDPCLSVSCFNDGTCQKYPDDPRGYRCLCNRGFTGKDCSTIDHCADHKCQNAECVNDPANGTYKCECHYEWDGRHCDRHCPAYLCNHGGTCFIQRNGYYGCHCRPGWRGNRCEIEKDECASQPCANGATCRDLPNDFHCRCAPGWSGKQCDLVCRDFYDKCGSWAKEGKCPSKDDVRDFFNMNCPLSCKLCEKNANVTDEESVAGKMKPLISPHLEPLSWLVGFWQNNRSFDNIHFPFDFTTETYTYMYTLKIQPSQMIFFGLPTLSFHSEAVSNDNPKERFMRKGLIMLLWQNGANKLPKLAMSTTTSEGLHLIEEGTVKGKEVDMHVTYVDEQFMEADIPSMLKLNWKFDGLFLKQTHHKVDASGDVKRSTIYLHKLA